MKEKIHFALALILLIFTFNACSSNPLEEDTPKQEEPAEPTKPNEPEDSNVILSENTILLNESLEKYVINNVTGTSLEIDASIKESELPQIGQILLYGSISDKFPFGFLGKVKQITKNQGKYEIETEPVSLEEAFDKLYINETPEIILENTDSLNSRSVSLYADEDGYVGLQTRWAVEFGAISEKEWTSTSSQSGAISGGIESGSGIGIKLKCFIDIDKKAQKEPHIEFTFLSKTFYGFGIDIKGNLSRKYTKGIKKVSIAPVLLPTGALTKIILHPEFILSAFMNFDGEFEYSSESHSQQQWEMSFIYEHGQARFESQNINEQKNTSSVESFQLMGSISTGLSMGIKMKLFNNENISSELTASAGPSIAAEISYKNEDLENMYDKLKDSKITFTPCNVTAQIGVETPFFLKDTKASGEIELLNFSIGEKDYYLFPEFEEAEAIWKDNKINVSYNVSRDLLLPVELGIRLMDEEKKKLEDSEEQIEYKNESTPTIQVNSTFGKVSKNKNYMACPTVKLPIFGKITASPESKIEGVTIITGDASILDQNTAIVTCEYKNTISWTKKVGVEFCDEAGNKQEIFQSITEDGTYDFQLTGLLPKMTYTYRAFVIIDGEYVYASNSNSFISSEIIDIKDITFEIIPSFKNGWPNTIGLSDYDITSRERRYLKFWYDVLCNDIQKLQGISNWGSVLYKNGEIYDTQKSTKSNVSFNVIRCNEEDLTIYNDTYTAIADKAIYEIGLYIERTDSLGQTIVETTEAKPIVPIYTQKPEIVISSIENVFDTTISEWEGNIQKQLHYLLHYKAQGLFWVKPIIGTKNEGEIDLLHICPLDESYYTYAAGYGYYNNQRPQTIRIAAEDLTTGKIITSNVVNIP